MGLPWCFVIFGFCASRNRGIKTSKLLESAMFMTSCAARSETSTVGFGFDQDNMRKRTDEVIVLSM